MEKGFTQRMGRKGRRPGNFLLDSRPAFPQAGGMKISAGLSRVQVVLVVALILVVSGFRVARAAWWPELPNFSPLAAMAFCGGLFLPGVAAWIVPLAVVGISDFALAWVAGYPPSGSWQVVTVGAVLVAVGLGRWLRARGSFSLGGFLGLLLAGGVTFYLVANTAAWLVSPDYAKTLAGFFQAQTTGLPGDPPSWVFLRNSLLGDVVVGGLILAVRFLARSDIPLQQALDVKVGDQARRAGGVADAKVA
jgi:hypothetical protein